MEKEYYSGGYEPFVLKKCDKVWTGKNSTDWNDNNNWQPAGVPLFDKDVTIPPANNYPEINTNVSCNNLIVNHSSITVNKDANLDVRGFVYNVGDINGEGSLTRKCTSSNATYGSGSYNIDSINIDGGDWDLTSIYVGSPNTLTLNSIVNFKSDHKLVMNETGLLMLKKPFFTGFNNKRYVLFNRSYPLETVNNQLSPLVIQLYNSNLQQDTILFTTIPIGTSLTSYSPFAFTFYKANVGVNLVLYETNAVGKNGLTGDTVKTGVVNKSWVITDGFNTLKKIRFSWTINDEAPGFDHNNCFISYYRGSSWLKGNTMAASLNNGVYGIEEVEPTNPLNKYPFIVSSDFSVLPIQLKYFTAELINDNSFLRWQTENEINSSYFNIQRSTDGINFTTIGKVNASGNSSSSKTYNYTDNISNLNYGIIYYRIEEVDTDGRTTLSQIRTVKKSSQNLFTIYPNPATQVISINGKNIQRIEMYDADGKLVFTKESVITNFITIRVNNLSTGIYTVVVKDTNGMSESKKLVIK